jgi:hypothetical protein
MCVCVCVCVLQDEEEQKVIDAMRNAIAAMKQGISDGKVCLACCFGCIPVPLRL